MTISWRKMSFKRRASDHYQNQNIIGFYKAKVNFFLIFLQNKLSEAKNNLYENYHVLNLQYLRGGVIVINLVSIQNLLVSLEKTLYGAFPCCLAILARSSKFLSYLYKTQNRNKKFQLDINILASPEADRGNCWTVSQCKAPQSLLKKFKISNVEKITGKSHVNY